ncbi:hypothetical protein Dimus_000076 [Dionaea muscipula]
MGRMVNDQRKGEREDKGVSSTPVGPVIPGGGRVEVVPMKGGGPPLKGKQLAEERWVPAKRGARVGVTKEMIRGTDMSVPSRFQPLRGEKEGRVCSEAMEGQSRIEQVVDLQVREMLLPLVLGDHDNRELEREGPQ